MLGDVSNQLTEYGKSVGEIIDLSTMPDIELKIKDAAQNQMLDLKRAMGNLVHVGGYLQLAYAGSRGFSCNVKIVTILCDYQQLVINSYNACQKFVDSCLFVIKQNKLAIQVAERSTLDISMKMLLACEKTIGEMIKLSDQLVNECDQICESSKNALREAAENDVSSRKQKKEIEESLSKLGVQEAELKSRRKDLEALVNEEKENELNASSKADHEQQRIFVLSMCQAFLKPLNIGENLGQVFGSLFAAPNFNRSTSSEKEEGSGKTAKFFAELLKSKNESKENLIKNEASLEAKKEELQKLKKGKSVDPKEKNALKKEIRELKILVEKQRKANEESNQLFKGIIERSDKLAQSYAEKESLAAQRRREWQSKQLECNAEFARTVSELKSKHKENDELGKAIKSLEVAIKALGKVKTIFEYNRSYWDSVQHNCRLLSLAHESIGTLADAELKEMWVEQIQEGQKQWCYLGALNAIALKFILPAKTKVNSIMSDLPTKEEGDKMIESGCDAFLLELEDENRFLELSQNEEGEKEK